MFMGVRALRDSGGLLELLQFKFGMSRLSRV
jgi:hypothetical protein